MNKINYNKILSLKEKIDQLTPEELSILIGLINQEVNRGESTFTTRTKTKNWDMSYTPSQSTIKDNTIFDEYVELFKRDFITFLNKMFKVGSNKYLIFNKGNEVQKGKDVELVLDVKLKPGYFNIQPKSGIFVKISFLFSNNVMLYKYIFDSGENTINSNYFKEYNIFFENLTELILKHLK